MSFRDDLRRVRFGGGRQLIGASFRGVPFFVESAERAGGRRAVVHEFPLRDDPFVEDLGRKARAFRIEGYVVGDDYLAQRDALLSALEDTSGTGELVHPYYGIVRAICVGVSVRDTRADGGVATFAIEFAETPNQAPVPVEVIDDAEQVSDASDLAAIATAEEFAEQYDDEGLPAFALDSAEAALASAAASVADVLGPIISSTQELAALSGRVAVITAQAAALVRSPASILGAFRETLTGLAETMLAAPGAVMDALVEAYAFDLGSPPIIAITATRERELANQTALGNALRRLIAIEAARLAPLVPYASLEEAMTARDSVTAILEEQASSAGDTAYPALVNLRSKVLRAVPGGEAFARVVTVTRREPIPSLVLTYQLYGSVDNEADVLARNGIRHPGFVSGDLKVLTDE